MYKLYIEHQNRQIEPLTLEGVTLTAKNRSPGVLEFKTYNDDVAVFEEGDVVTFYDESNGKKSIFFGRIINMVSDGNRLISVEAYDNIYYLKSRDSYNFVGQRASDIVRSLVKNIGLPLGTVDETYYTIPYLCAPDSTLAGIIDKALYEEKMASHENYALYCDFDKITLKNVRNIQVPIAVTDDNAAGCLKCASINNSYNIVKLSYSDKSQGGERKYVKENGALVDKWGPLQYHEKVSEEINMLSRAEELLQEMAKSDVSISITDTAGDIRVRPGSLIAVQLKTPAVNLEAYVISVKHIFRSNLHLMSLELKASL